jgi:AraC family transcriptional regulator
MPEGSWPSGRIGPAAGPSRRPPGTLEWDRPQGLVLKKFRSWERVSAAVVSRPASESYWRGDQHLVGLALSGFRRASAQAEGGRVQQIEPIAPRLASFQPASVGVRFAVSPSASEFTFAQIIQQPETYRDLASEVSSPASLSSLEPRPAFDDPQVALLVQAIVNEIDGGALDHLLVNVLNTALAVQIARHFHGPAMRLLPAGRLSRERLRRVLDYIEDHLGDSLSMTEMAGIACLSPFHFSRCFKRSMGMGLHRYVVKRRMERARHLVLHSDMSLTDIAAAVGFDSQSSFTSCFGREIGVSPGRLRRDHSHPQDIAGGSYGPHFDR